MADLTQPVITELIDGVLLVTINRPEVRNAVNQEVAVAIGDAVERAENDRDVRVLVLTGAGDKAFCSGGDLKAIWGGEPSWVIGHQEWGFAGYVRHFTSKPTIAAVNGVAIGGGMELILASDCAIAAERASLGLPDVKMAGVAGAGGLIRLPMQIPRKIALEMIFTGERMDALTAERWGLVNRVVGDDVLLEETMRFAAQIAANVPSAVQASKRIALGFVNGKVTPEIPYWELNDVESKALRELPEWREGRQAFVEKRAPSWKET